MLLYFFPMYFLDFFFEKNFLFFCFSSKYHNFVKKKSYGLEKHTQGTSGGILKICRRNLKKHQFLLIFDDFRQNWHFWSYFLISEGHLWVCKTMGNRQTHFLFSQIKREVHGDNFRNFKHSIIFKSYEDISVWSGLAFESKSQTKLH